MHVCARTGGVVVGSGLLKLVGGQGQQLLPLKQQVQLPDGVAITLVGLNRTRRCINRRSNTGTIP